jgi:hypothetical protein
MDILSDSLVLVLLLVWTLFSSGAFYLALNATKRPDIPPTTASVPAVSEPKVSKDSEPDDSESDTKPSPSSPVIDEAYKYIHQRWNYKTHTWEDFEPLDSVTHDSVIFIVYRRHPEANEMSPVERLVEVHSEELKNFLRGSLKFVGELYEPLPKVCPIRVRRSCRLTPGTCLITWCRCRVKWTG